MEPRSDGFVGQPPHTARPRNAVRESRDERTGLATGWGRTEHSPARPTRFERDAPATPLGVGRLFYNDAAGAAAAAAVTRSSGDRVPATVTAAGGKVRMSLTKPDGTVLQAVTAGRDVIGIGEKGERWVLDLENLTNFRLELVASVDGLDAIDGRPAALTKRGYICGPGERIRIRGWRTGLDEVAAFSFSSTGESYAGQRHGDIRNVGVAGCAVFNEKGTSPSPALAGPAQTADPLLIEPGEGGFATPPERR